MHSTTIRASHVIAGILWLMSAGFLAAIIVLLIFETEDDWARACFGAEILSANLALVLSVRAIHQNHCDAVHAAYRQGVTDGSHEAQVRSLW